MSGVADKKQIDVQRFRTLLLNLRSPMNRLPFKSGCKTLYLDVLDSRPTVSVERLSLFCIAVVVFVIVTLCVNLFRIRALTILYVTFGKIAPSAEHCIP